MKGPDQLTSERYDGELTSRGSGGHAIEFRPMVNFSQGPTAFFADDNWQTIRLSWSALEGQDLRDGQRFTAELGDPC